MNKVRLASTWVAVLIAAIVVSSCGSSPPAHHKAAASSTTTTTAAPTTTSTSVTATTTTRPGVTVPNVIGLKIVAAHNALRAAGLPSVGLNHPCNKGTLASQSVVSSLSVAGPPPNPNVGATPLEPGATVPPRTRVGITWSGCYGDQSVVPNVVGLTFPAARHALRSAGLAWACFSAGAATTTTTSTTSTTSPPGSTTSTLPPSTTTTAKPPATVLSQTVPAGTVLKPGTPVDFTMHRCPQ